MTGANITAILEYGDWKKWRASLRDSGELALAARAWCTSSHWKDHTPALEDWKAVIEDLSAAGLAEAAVSEMTASEDPPFPAIPLFEDEQIRDFCRVLSDPEAAIVVAEKLESQDGWLTVDRAQVARQCWESLTSRGKGGLGFGAWRWMLKDAVSRQVALPSAEEAPALVAGSSRLRKQAAAELEQAVRLRLESGVDTESALRLADALSLWRDPGFLAWAFPWFAKTGQPAEMRARLEAALAAGFSIEDASLAARLRELGFIVQGARNGRMCAALFESAPDQNDWAAIESEARLRAPGASAAHPLVEMAAYLRDCDMPVEAEGAAWRNLRLVLHTFRGLLDVDASRPEGPLPALELAAAIRSSTTIGEVALDIVGIAGSYRAQSRWWRALYLGLRPSARRGGFGHANDRFDAAVRMVRSHANWLTEADVRAMQSGFAEKGRS